MRRVIWILALAAVVMGGWLSGCRNHGGDDDPTWVFATPGEGGTLTALATDPIHSQFQVAGTYGGIFRSADGGTSWAWVAPSLRGEPITALRFHPLDTWRVYAGTGRSGLQLSQDGGRYFQPQNGDLPPGTPDRRVTALALDPTSLSNIYLSLGRARVHRSQDGGKTWVLKVLGLSANEVYDMAVDHRDARVIYAATDQGIFRSTNQGDAWTALTTPLDLTSILVHPTVAGWLFAAGPGGVWRSIDNGQQWAPFENGLPAPTATHHARRITHDPANPTDLYLAGLEGVWRARSGQNLWEGINQGLGVTRNRVVGPMVVVGQGAQIGPILLAGVNGEGYYRSDNGGLSWLRQGTGLHAVTVRTLGVSQANADVFYVGTPGRVWRSLDGGGRFEDASGDLTGLARSVHDMWVDPRDDQRVVVATDDGVYRTGDRGGIWYRANGSGPAVSLAVHRGVGDYALMFAVGPEGVYRSMDGGASFVLVAVGSMLVNLTDVVIDPADGNFVYAVRSDRGVLYSRNQGQTWQQASVGLTENLGYEQVQFDDQDPSRLLLSARAGGVFASRDSGVSWQPASTGLPSPPAASLLVVDPRNDLAHRGRSVVLVPGTGLYSSMDAGWLWVPFHVHSSVAGALSLALAPGASNRVYVGVVGGVYRHL